ncbi:MULTISPECIES: biosynthetic peptidoglycan transglycosylase [unclassified Breznakia]|uniref:biosynthetic peptidoglycan transglycosylase n=1 Tax=unclassified Breznakia TaxID=2623764 RepID=UPI0024068D96|nr:MULTISPECIES: biosynthetic peptidoglycan transglycosylase [unclassified Breznakia]
MVLIIVLFILIAFIAGVGYLGYKDVTDKVSIEEKVNQIRSDENYVTLDEISQYMKDSIIAIEDRRFYDHGGVDYYALARSVVVNVTNQGNQGGSTLTQQLAKNMYFMDDNTGIRKVSEAFVARELERNYTKDEILEMYLNIVYYGDGYYGIYDAAKGYYNTHPKDLTLTQASVLAGLPQAPSVYALSNKNEITKDRQKQVIKSMLELNMITKREYEEAMNAEIY